MDRYCKWFETQPRFRRVKLLDKTMTLPQRVATVKEFLGKPVPVKDVRLDDRNRRLLAAWLDRYTAEHGARIMENMLQTHPGIARLPPERQQAVLRESVLRRLQSGGPNGQLSITESEMARLRRAFAGIAPNWTKKGLRNAIESSPTGSARRPPWSSTNNWPITLRARWSAISSGSN